MFDLYREQVLDRYRSPHFAGEVPEPSLVAEGANSSCGDEVRITVQVNDQGIITHAQHQTRACAVCSASTDLLLEKIQNQPVAAIGQITPEDIQESLGIELSPTRLKCALLPLEALKAAVKKD